MGKVLALRRGIGNTTGSGSEVNLTIPGYR